MYTPLASLASVDGVSYYIPASHLPVARGTPRLIFGNNNQHGAVLNPACLFVLDSEIELTAESLSSTVQSWLKTDDVFCPTFLSSVYLLTTKESDLCDVNGDLKALFQSWETRQAYTIPCPRPENGYSFTRSGPYFLSHDAFHPAWRIFPDSHQAFVFPVVPAGEDQRRFMIPGVVGVPVPSRCFYDKPSQEKPLSGMRVVIKDNIDMAGVPSSVGNRAFGELYGPRLQSATCVERLLDAGAVILGRVKTVQFASGESAKDWFDYQAPFNPRGDGYQDPECSSAGSAVACAAYDWVDIAIGTDTIGSIIGPACQQGVFGLRPSLGGVSTCGVFPVSKELDTVGVFARKARVCAAAMRVLSNNRVVLLTRTLNLELLYPKDCFGEYPDEYLSFVEPFVSKLEAFLHTRRSEISLDTEFMQAGIAGRIGIRDYLATTAAHIQLHDCYRNCAPFMDDYREKFNRTPFVDPYIRYKWNLGKELTNEQYKEALHQRDAFRDWVLGDILPSPSNRDSLNKILVMPNGFMHPVYRHEYDGQTLEQGASQKQGFGFKYPITFVVLSGVPFVNVPIGQFPYKSTVTERTEYLPVSIGLAAPKGCDIQLMHLLENFLDSSQDLWASVRSGSVAFPVP